MRAPSIRPAAFQFAARAKTWSSALIGAFIVWQLIFIPLANLLDFFPHRALRRDELTDLREVPPELVQAPLAVHALSAVTDRWAQATGQQQMWWLFAPQFPPQATFPAVELRWAEQPNGERLSPVRLLSSLEPANSTSYFRPPGSDDRLFQFEIHLGLGLVFWNEQSGAAEPEAWRKMFEDIVRMQWKSIRAYLRWRIREFAVQHPELPPPDEATLLIRIYPTPKPGESLSKPIQPITQPLARWRLAEEGHARHLPVEAFDPFARQFVPVPVEAGVTDE